MIYVAKDFSVVNLQNFVVHIVATDRDTLKDYIKDYKGIKRYKNNKITSRDLVAVKLSKDTYVLCFIWPAWAAINLP